jgi:DNA adenine methylase
MIEQIWTPLPSPFRWVGGKSRMRQAIIRLLPPHHTYVELFAGAAWVFFGKAPGSVEILNDLDQDVITFFRVIRDQPDAFLASFEWELVSRAEFERLTRLDSTLLSDVERAHRFYYIIMAGWGGELRYPRFQTSINDGGHGNRLIGALQSLERRIRPIHNRLQGVILENLKWQDSFALHDYPGTVIYLDPPYPGNGCNYAYNMSEPEKHYQLASVLHQAKCQWLLSSYDTDFVRDLFADYTIIPLESKSGMKTAKHGTTRVINKEVVICNDTIYPL